MARVNENGSGRLMSLFGLRRMHMCGMLDSSSIYELFVEAAEYDTSGGSHKAHWGLNFIVHARKISRAYSTDIPE